MLNQPVFQHTYKVRLRRHRTSRSDDCRNWDNVTTFSAFHFYFLINFPFRLRLKNVQKRKRIKSAVRSNTANHENSLVKANA